jgi:hypothetical protein
VISLETREAAEAMTVEVTPKVTDRWSRLRAVPAGLAIAIARPEAAPPAEFALYEFRTGVSG